VLGKQRRLSRHSLREVVFKRCDNTGVELYAPAPQQRAIGRILNQRMLEGVLRIGGSATLENQFGSHELRQGGVDIVVTALMSS
jgi:hypothetical protein